MKTSFYGTEPCIGSRVLSGSEGPFSLSCSLSLFFSLTLHGKFSKRHDFQRIEQFTSGNCV
jgi:hypothetical protein